MKKFLILLILLLPNLVLAKFDGRISPPSDIDPNFKIAIVVPGQGPTGFTALYTYDYYQVKLNLEKDCAGGVKAPCLDANTGGAFFVYDIPADGVMSFSMPHQIVQSYQLSSPKTAEIISSVNLLLESGEMFKANAPKKLFFSNATSTEETFDDSKMAILQNGAIIFLVVAFLGLAWLGWRKYRKSV